MQAIMLYFSGSGVQIFSLGTIFMLVTGPIGALLGILRSELKLETWLVSGNTGRRAPAGLDRQASPLPAGEQQVLPPTLYLCSRSAVPHLDFAPLIYCP